MLEFVRRASADVGEAFESMSKRLDDTVSGLASSILPDIDWSKLFADSLAGVALIGFTSKRKRTEENSGTSTSNVAEEGQALHGVGEGNIDKGFQLKIKAGGTELRGTYPIAPPNVVPPIIRNVTRKDLAVPAVHSMLYRHGSRHTPHRDVKKEVPHQSESPGKPSSSAADPPPP